MNSGRNGEWFATTPEFWERIPMAIIGWQVWYADGSVVNSSEMAWKHAPRDGVEVLMVHHPGGFRTVVTGRDEYTLPGEAESKFGLEIDPDEFHHMLDAAMQDGWRP